LHPIQDALALLGRQPGLLCGRGLCQGLVRRGELLLQLVIFLLQRDKLMPGILVLPQGRDGLSHFFRIDLGYQIRSDHDGVPIEGRVGRLLEYKDQPRGIGSDLILCHIKTIYDGDAFEIYGDLFQGVRFAASVARRSASSLVSRFPILYSPWAATTRISARVMVGQAHRIMNSVTRRIVLTI